MVVDEIVENTKITGVPSKFLYQPETFENILNKPIAQSLEETPPRYV